MKRRYIVIKPFINKVLGRLNIGRVILHKELKHLTNWDIEDKIYIQDFREVKLPFNYGLIFLSSEFQHPEGEEEETREEMIERLLCEMKKCCNCQSNQSFGKCKCDKCLECCDE